MTRTRVLVLTLLAMLVLAANSLLCRAALNLTGIDAASFTLVRIVSGALALWLIVRLRDGKAVSAGSWPSALALFVYAAAFSFAYLSLTAATGALLLFGTVQATMIGFGLYRGERLGGRQSLGLVCALAGLVGLLLPGLSAPPVQGAALMLAAGAAWGVYSLRAKGSGDPLQATAGNFLRAAAFAAALNLVTLPWLALDAAGVGCAIASGAIASGVGYAISYTALAGLKATSAATVQLSVPVIAAVGGIAVLGEPLTLRLVIASAAILGGIAIVIARRSAGPDELKACAAGRARAARPVRGTSAADNSRAMPLDSSAVAIRLSTIAWPADHLHHDDEGRDRALRGRRQKADHAERDQGNRRLRRHPRTSCGHVVANACTDGQRGREHASRHPVHADNQVAQNFSSVYSAGRVRPALRAGRGSARSRRRPWRRSSGCRSAPRRSPHKPRQNAAGMSRRQRLNGRAGRAPRPRSGARTAPRPGRRHGDQQPGQN
jgi:drug/metabolite transporter (DMT)-like permease